MDRQAVHRAELWAGAVTAVKGSFAVWVGVVWCLGPWGGWSGDGGVRRGRRQVTGQTSDGGEKC